MGDIQTNNTLRVEKWRINDELRLVFSYEPKDGKFDDYFSMPAVPDEFDSNPLLGLLLKNSEYHAHLSATKSGAKVLERFHDNSERKSEETVPTMWAFGLPEYGLTYREIVNLPTTANVTWRPSSDNSMELSLDFVHADQDLSLLATFSSAPCVEHCRLSADDWTHEIDFTYTTSNTNEKLIQLVDRKASGADAPSIFSRFVISDITPDSLTESECRLPAFGVPEPEEFRRWSATTFTFLLLVIGSVCVFSLWMHRRAVHRNA
ncbi:MAG: hypothetical protein Aurels2KO_50920 [Aureliella sp.]